MRTSISPPADFLAERKKISDSSFDAVYNEVRQIATAFMMLERPWHTLQATAIVHEAYLRLLTTPRGAVVSRAQLLVIATRTIRSVLVDHARRRNRLKRGGASRHRIAINPDHIPAPTPSISDIDVLAIHDALTRLEAVSPQAAEVVELRFFGGLSEVEIAEATSLSRRTVQRRWRAASVWLSRDLASRTWRHGAEPQAADEAPV